MLSELLPFPIIPHCSPSVLFRLGKSDIIHTKTRPLFGWKFPMKSQLIPLLILVAWGEWWGILFKNVWIGACWPIYAAFLKWVAVYPLFMLRVGAIHYDGAGAAIRVYLKATLLRFDGRLVAAALTRWFAAETTVRLVFQKSLKRLRTWLADLWKRLSQVQRYQT